MPRLKDITLPTVTVSDTDGIAAAIKREKLTPEQMVEVAVYLKREKAKADALSELEKAIKEKIEAYYDKLAPDAREGIRTEAGMTTYSPPKETVTITDRDTTVESLTNEQLRISYKPDVKALETILKPDAFERLVTRTTAEKGTVSIRDSKGDFEEIDFSDF